MVAARLARAARWQPAARLRRAVACLAASALLVAAGRSDERDGRDRFGTASPHRRRLPRVPAGGRRVHSGVLRRRIDRGRGHLDGGGTAGRGQHRRRHALPLPAGGERESDERRPASPGGARGRRRGREPARVRRTQSHRTAPRDRAAERSLRPVHRRVRARAGDAGARGRGRRPIDGRHGVAREGAVRRRWLAERRSPRTRRGQALPRPRRSRSGLLHLRHEHDRRRGSGARGRSRLRRPRPRPVRLLRRHPGPEVRRLGLHLGIRDDRRELHGARRGGLCGLRAGGCRAARWRP